MTNALYTDSECTEQYCAAGAFNAEEFVKKCNIVSENGKKKLSIPKLYTAADTEVTHYLMPWETAEKKYSVVVGRKDEVYLLDNLVGASGKEWNGILGSNSNFWDGADLKAYALKPTGIFPSPATAITDGGLNKLRCFFYNYPSNLSGTTGYKGLATNCELFYGNGHYPYIISQIGSKTYSRNNNSDTTAPFPVAEGGWHARNTFLRCIETAMGTKNLCAATRFSGGINSNNSATNESTISMYGGVRWKKSEDQSGAIPHGEDALTGSTRTQQAVGKIWLQQLTTIHSTARYLKTRLPYRLHRNSASVLERPMFSTDANGGTRIRHHPAHSTRRLCLRER